MHHITATDGTRLHVKDWGSGRPVILIHGWPLSADSWDDQAMAIAYDRRGFGRSTQPWIGYDYDTLADDLAAVIEQSGARDAVLVGFSMGGGEVASYLSRYAGKSVVQAVRVSSVLPFLLKTPGNPTGTAQGRLRPHRARPQRGQTRFPRRLLPDLLRCRHDAGNGQRRTAGVGARRRDAGQPQATLACLDSFSSTDFRADLAAFAVPTLGIHGTGQDSAHRRVQPGRGEGHQAQHAGRIRRRAAWGVSPPTSVGSCRTCSTFPRAESRYARRAQR